MIRRSSKKFIDQLLENNKSWNILDIGCGYTAHKNANIVCDIQDLSHYYEDKRFYKLTSNILPFKDKEFDFVIASHVVEHVKDVNIFLKELQRVSSKGYIELPSILEDNLVFENKNNHLWHMEFDDDDKKLIISKKIQFLDPILTVSSAKKFSKYFRQSLVLELLWENSIEFNIVEKNFNENDKISRISLIRKYFSKLLRNLIR